MRWVVFAVLLFGTVAFGQLAQTGPQPAYEGQNVSAVSLIANPHRDLSPLLPLVSQKAGAPYVGTKIQESADRVETSRWIHRCSGHRRT